ncbi:MAG: fibrillarin-like rRNA/tRNA 2'-O-methyltransferase [Candidatus Marsarchaeota archaeon]|nr:fibrillarin-like rRNA/tRNA 2'-O-methyltransferase [Candidatus Marsarchaeota archaeon]MCL5412957.1 fibrillarin-like rRNA/tRNA 2'-O-methyltransferase [Candidatus Marsarchaeota archaeon]
MKIKRLFDGVFRIEGRLATVNLAKNAKVYGEDLVEDGGIQYRMWNPYRSKLAAAIINGLKNLIMPSGSHVLYLGAATGTTSSHVSDIVGADGLVYCIEISERSMRDLIKICEKRSNILPILQDARNVDAYASDVGTADILYQDVSARDQADILLRNSELLKKGGYAYVAIKSQSIDISRRPEEVFKEFLDSVMTSFDVIERLDLAPYDDMHLFVVLRKK